MTSSRINWSKEKFIDGLTQIIQDPNEDRILKLKCCKLFLFAAVLDQNMERVDFAVNNGADVRWGLDPGTRGVLLLVGYDVPEMPSPESLGASYGLSSQLQSSEEAYPSG